MSLREVVRGFKADAERLGWKDAVLKAIRLKDTVLEKGSEKELVGEDRMGNRYYEIKGVLETQSRMRWVEPANTKTYDGSAVPPEWHNWLHRMTDVPPTKRTGFTAVEPKFKKDHRENPTGSQRAFLQPGHFLNPSFRTSKNAQKVEYWSPQQPQNQS